MAIITSNMGKIGIGFVSCFFDVVLLIQHFCLYGENNTTVVSKIEEENPFLSNKRLDSIDSTKGQSLDILVMNLKPYSPIQL